MIRLLVSASWKLSGLRSPYEDEDLTESCAIVSWLPHSIVSWNPHWIVSWTPHCNDDLSRSVECWVLSAIAESCDWESTSIRIRKFDPWLSGRTGFAEQDSTAVTAVETDSSLEDI